MGMPEFFKHNQVLKVNGQTVKICLGLQLETNGIELRTFKTISDEEILAQKLQRDRRKEHIIHQFIAKYLKTETEII